MFYVYYPLKSWSVNVFGWNIWEEFVENALQGVTVSCYEGYLREVVVCESVVNELDEGNAEGSSYSVTKIKPVVV